MQDQYFGDEGDFVKFRLLRKICGITADDGGPRLPLGVVWYRVELGEGSKSTEGGRTGYLYQDGNETADPDLFLFLRECVDENDRRISRLHDSSMFPGAVWYFEEAPRPRQGDSRADWNAGALSTVRDSRVVFLDPDNGLAPPSVEKHHARATKYVFWDELQEFCSLKGDPTVVVYQHRRRVAAMQQVAEQVRGIRTCTGRDQVVAVMDPKLSQRLFYVIPSTRESERKLALSRIKAITMSDVCIGLLSSPGPEDRLERQQSHRSP